MSDLLERNLATLVRDSVARPDEEAALRRFLRATRPAARTRWMPAAAAVFLGALCLWVMLAREPATVPAQEAPRAKEIDEWVSRLSAQEVADRDKAEKQIATLAADLAHALAALDRLRNTEDVELRGRAARLRTSLSDRLRDALALPGAIRDSIATVREKWLKRDFTNLEETIRKAFEPLELTYLHVATKVEISDHMESANNEEFMKFRPSGRLGGRRDLLTQPVFDALCADDGIIGLDWDTPIAPKKSDDLASLGKCLLFTLPDGTVTKEGKVNWPGYVVVAYRAGKK